MIDQYTVDHHYLVALRTIEKAVRSGRLDYDDGLHIVLNLRSELDDVTNDTAITAMQHFQAVALQYEEPKAEWTDAYAN